jgi:hypothetical protein
MSATVTVYNMGGQEVLGRVGLQHAIKMVYQGKALIKETVPGRKFGKFDLPKAVELLRYVYARWKYDRTGEVPFSKRGVLRRDNYICAYCGGHGDTVDHILPKWQGNSASWMNSVAACRPCNQKKGGRSPKEAGMKLRFSPRVPSFHEAYGWTHPD